MQDRVRLNVPAEPHYARSVRMLAATLAVSCGMSVDDVEDVRMAAEEGFVYACSTAPQTCGISFELAPNEVTIDFSLGLNEARPDQDNEAELGGDLYLVALLLEAVCDEFSLIDSDEGSYLHLVKRTAHVE
ncbi:ATP-binding protein [uncultured Olegusella sp.]|uniref:ATP-binding protein n=1 Tax=uncultured Olegusella sp. TaxID=1979846 RepID=UPI00345CF13C